MPENTSASIVEDASGTKYFSNLPVHIARIGRPRGSRNWSNKTAKENIQKVFEGLGGWEAMLNWARFHPNEFYGEVYPRLLAKEGMTKGDSEIRVLVYATNGQQSESLGIKTNDEPIDADSDLSPG